MGLKKNFFKGLQGGVNHSPLKMHDGTLNRKTHPNGFFSKKIDPVREVAQDNLVTNRQVRKPSKIENEKIAESELAKMATKTRNSVNEKYRKSRLDAMKLKYPDASEAELKDYLFSNEKGLPANNVNSQSGSNVPRLGFKGQQFTGPNTPSDALVISNNYLTSGGVIDPYQFSINDPRDKDNILFGLNAEQKKALVDQNIENLNLDPRDKQQNYQYESLKNFNDWYSDPVTQERLLNQAQFSGNVRKPTVSVYNKDKPNKFGIPGAEDVAGSLYSQADIDNTISSITGKKFTFNKEYGNTLASVDPDDTNVDVNMFAKYYSQPTKFSKVTGKEYGINYEPGKPSRNDVINIAPNTVDMASYSGGVNSEPLSFSDWRDMRYDQGKSTGSRDYDNEFSQTTAKAAGEHELLHSTRLDKAMDPYLRSILKRREKLSKYGNYSYNTDEGELYANFHELRRTLDMKPGEQFTKESLEKRMSDKKLNNINNDFIRNFSEESLLEALNNVASVDDKSKGKLQFDFLKSQEDINNYEMNA